MLNNLGWEKIEESVKNIVDCSVSLVHIYTSYEHITKVDLYTCKTLLQIALRGVEVLYKETDFYTKILNLITNIDDKYNN